MRKLILIPVLFIALLMCNGSYAQVHVNVNIGLQPVWGPVGYDHVDYYYLPDIEAYYDVPNRRYVYMEGGRWIFGAVLPARFHDYDVYHGYKVVINEPTPYLHHDVYRVKYAGYKGRRDQVVIRDSHEEKYWEIKEHPEHGKWKGGGHGEKEHGRGEHGEHGRH